jgi:thiamine pyrophosphate-dependent acetolactate synthase large subunit-like protein
MDVGSYLADITRLAISTRRSAAGDSPKPARLTSDTCRSIVGRDNGIAASVGSCAFAAPDSVYAVSQQYQLPIFTVVLDNGGWQAVKASVQRVYPDGAAQRTDAFLSRLRSGRQGEQRCFADVARAFGAHGERVSDPDQLDAAIAGCLHAVDNGRAAVLHVDIVPL